MLGTKLPSLYHCWKPLMVCGYRVETYLDRAERRSIRVFFWSGMAYCRRAVRNTLLHTANRFCLPEITPASRLGRQFPQGLRKNQMHGDLLSRGFLPISRRTSCVVQLFILHLGDAFDAWLTTSWGKQTRAAAQRACERRCVTRVRRWRS